MIPNNMNQQWIVIYLLIASIEISQQKSTPDSTSYIAAVLEFQPKYIANNSELTLRANSDRYVERIKTAAQNNVDIIVFPEDGLTSVYLPKREKMQDWTTVIPAASENYIPCTQDTPEISEAMKKISCAARENQIYVVINIAEKLSCTGSTCPKDNLFFYNSNVVFDRSGKIIARYRKTNLFVEPQFNVTAVPEIVTFDTDFGVKFGTFTCFDIMFYEPAIKLVRLHQITDIVFPTAWFSEVPFLTAIQVQAGWSFSGDVNLLASGYNRPDSGNAGSGIYLGRKGVGKAIMPQYSHEEMLIYKVPKIKDKTRSNRYLAHSKDHDKEYQYYYGKEHIHDELRKKRNDAMKDNNTLFLLYDKMHNFQTVSLENNMSTTICHNDFCCEFKIEVTKTDPRIKYRLVAFNGVRSFYVYNGSVAVCGIIQCANNSLSSCGSVRKSATIFNNIEISATFHNYKNLLIMPSTLNSEFLPLQNMTFDDHFHDEHVHITISLDSDTSDLVTFGLYARNFSGDINAAVSYNVVHYIIALPIILLLSCNFKDTYNMQ